MQSNRLLPEEKPEDEVAGTSSAVSSVVPWRLQVTPLRQSHEYDCGLACVSMVLVGVLQSYNLPYDRWSHPQAVCEFYANASGSNRSIWTIDLFVLLHDLVKAENMEERLQLRYTTEVVGCNPEFATQPFYVLDFSSDERRVEHQFRACLQGGRAVEQATCSTEQFLASVREPRTVLIVLIDSAYLLRHYRQRFGPPSPHAAHATYYAGRLLSLFMGCFGCPAAVAVPPAPHEFQGHYVVVTGYDPVTDCVFVNNPSHLTPEEIPLETFEKSREAFGTDGDIIHITLG